MEQVLLSVNSEQSPVEGEKWPKLSKEYKKKKLEELGSGRADLELTGDMLDALTFKNTKEGIQIGFFGDQAWKADGHLKFSGLQNNCPKRRVLPGKGQDFDSKIQSGIDDILLQAKSDSADLTKSDLKDIETKGDLYSFLKELFGVESNAEAKFAALASEKVRSKLESADLLGLL